MPEPAILDSPCKSMKKPRHLQHVVHLIQRKVSKTGEMNCPWKRLFLHCDCKGSLEKEYQAQSGDSWTARLKQMISPKLLLWGLFFMADKMKSPPWQQG